MGFIGWWYESNTDNKLMMVRHNSIIWDIMCNYDEIKKKKKLNTNIDMSTDHSHSTYKNGPS